jgi:hypothetical protein
MSASHSQNWTQIFGSFFFLFPSVLFIFFLSYFFFLPVGAALPRQATLSCATRLPTTVSPWTELSRVAPWSALARAAAPGWLALTVAVPRRARCRGPCLELSRADPCPTLARITAPSMASTRRRRPTPSSPERPRPV